MEIKIKKILSLIIATTTILSCLASCQSSHIEDESKKDENVEIELSATAQEFYDNANIVYYDKQSTEKIDIQEGVTAIYGRNINADSIETDTSSFYTFNDKTTKSNSDSGNTITETYMIISVKQDDFIKTEYVSVVYNSDVDKDRIDKFIEGEFKENRLDSRIRNFIIKQIINDTTPPNNNINSTITVPQTSLVSSVIDTTYFISNYKPTENSKYPLMIYKNEIRYNIYTEADDLPDQDRYCIVSYTKMTPGNDISSLEAAEIASLKESELYNDKYSNAIVVQGVRTRFYNLNSNTDSFITMYPEESLDKVNGKTIPVTIKMTPYLPFSVNANTSAKISMDTDFNSSGNSTVQFKANKKFFSWRVRPCLSTEEFNYTAAIYLKTSSDTLNTEVGTSILYFYQNETEKDAVWAGSERSLTYRNK